MNKELTLEDILSSWVYVGNTPANGELYHDEKSDRSATIYSDYTRVFSGRRDGIKGNFPACYYNVDRIYPTNNT